MPGPEPCEDILLCVPDPYCVADSPPFLQKYLLLVHGHWRQNICFNLTDVIPKETHARNILGSRRFSFSFRKATLPHFFCLCFHLEHIRVMVFQDLVHQVQGCGFAVKKDTLFLHFNDHTGWDISECVGEGWTVISVNQYIWLLPIPIYCCGYSYRYRYK